MRDYCLIVSFKPHPVHSHKGAHIPLTDLSHDEAEEIKAIYEANPQVERVIMRRRLDVKI